MALPPAFDGLSSMSQTGIAHVPDHLRTQSLQRSAIGVQAIEHHRCKVRFYSTVEHVNALEQEKALGKAEMLTKVDLVILDELGYLPFSSSDGALRFHLLKRFDINLRHNQQP